MTPVEKWRFKETSSRLMGCNACGLIPEKKKTTDSRVSECRQCGLLAVMSDLKKNHSSKREGLQDSSETSSDTRLGSLDGDHNVQD